MAFLVRVRVVRWLKAGKRVPKGTPGAKRLNERSTKWYGVGVPGYHRRSGSHSRLTGCGFIDPPDLSAEAPAKLAGYLAGRLSKKRKGKGSRHESGSWAFVGVDEATQFTGPMLAYPRTRQRRSVNSDSLARRV